MLLSLLHPHHLLCSIITTILTATILTATTLTTNLPPQTLPPQYLPSSPLTYNQPSTQENNNASNIEQMKKKLEYESEHETREGAVREGAAREGTAREATSPNSLDFNNSVNNISNFEQMKKKLEYSLSQTREGTSPYSRGVQQPVRGLPQPSQQPSQQPPQQLPQQPPQQLPQQPPQQHPSYPNNHRNNHPNSHLINFPNLLVQSQNHQHSKPDNLKEESSVRGHYPQPSPNSLPIPSLSQSNPTARETMTIFNSIQNNPFLQQNQSEVQPLSPNTKKTTRRVDPHIAQIHNDGMPF